MFRSTVVAFFMMLIPATTMADPSCYDQSGSIAGTPNRCVCTSEFCNQAACEAAGGIWTDGCQSCSCEGLDDGDDGGDSSPSPSPAACFSADTTVTVAGAPHPVRMDELRVGDRVLTGKNTFESVYAFGHRDVNNKMDFVKLSMGRFTNSIVELSKEHMIYVNGKAIRADTVQVGDSLLQNGIPTEVTKISKVTKRGMYAPLTADGTIIVNGGIKASTYVALHTKSDTEDIKVNGITLPFLDQDLGVHLSLAPVRIVCSLTGSSLGFCRGAYDTQDGYNPYVAWGKMMIEWTEEQAAFFQILIIYGVVSIFVVLCAMESLLMGGTNPMVQATLFVAALVVYHNVSTRRQITPKKKAA